MMGIDADWAQLVEQELGAPAGSSVAAGLRKHLEADPQRWRGRLVTLDRENDEDLVLERTRHEEELRRHRPHSRFWNDEHSRYEGERRPLTARKTLIVDRLQHTKQLLRASGVNRHVAENPLELVRLMACDLAARLGLQVDIVVTERDGS